MGVDTFLGVDFLEQPDIFSGDLEQLLFFTIKPRVENVLPPLVTDVIMFECFDSFF